MDDIDLVQEVKSVAEEIRFAVDKVVIDATDPYSFTVTIKEGVTFHLSLSSRGFLVENQSQGDPNTQSEVIILKGQCFETIYAFLDKASPAYRVAFVQDISKKLNAISEG
uniref:GSK3-beta interaction protein-like n=1 Tax=Styela clava TaxID=7725 RepID=UPI00193ADE3B|nr:GSK3-beta interaction protein-like [Styela clava]